MSVVELLAVFADPVRLQELTLSQKMLASLITTLLGMGITFLSLVILQLAIMVMARFSKVPQEPAGANAVDETTIVPAGTLVPGETSEEVIVAITVSLAILLERSPNKLVIRNIRKIENPLPAWNKAGLAEHMHNHV